MNERKFRYQRSDFAPLPVKLEHMDISLSFVDGRVQGAGALRITARQPLDQVVLDARDLDVRSVDWIDPGVRDPLGATARRPLKHEYRRDAARLAVALPRRVAPGTSFILRTEAVCVPSDTILEGIYKDTTPPGCPPQYVSQCQQWGFQRILPVFDDCTAKCTMVTTIEADARYTHLISNGNISRTRNPGGRPVPKPGDPSRQVITYENDIPMPPYLFVVCVGTWDVLEDEVVYPSGRRVKLEYLAPPGRRAGAAAPMRILKDSILWQGRTQEYEYARDVYRTICMEKSNFGGMENVGNTTIVTDAALIDDYTNDRRLEYAHGVIAHEFEHNQCGSDVTMETPFDMWLNEAYTVDVDRQYRANRFDPDGARLDSVESMRAPISGPLAVEDGGHMGNIVREGFNDPDEVVDGVTYVKGAEVIRMLRLILGEEAFRRGRNLYFRRYEGGNANTDQFFACFEEASGRRLEPFKREWLHTIGYPRVEARHAYDPAARRLRVRFTQSRAGAGGLFHAPIQMAAVDEAGRDMPGTVRTLELAGETLQVEFPDVDRPAFLSLNRDCSFYGTFRHLDATPGQMARQALGDPNLFNRVEAMRQLTDIERLRLIHDPAYEVGEAWLATFAAALQDRTLRPGIKAHLLRVDEQSLDRSYLPQYRERHAARTRLMEAAARRHFDALRSAFDAVDTCRRGAEPTDGLEERRLKGVLLRTLIEAGTPEACAVAEEHFRRAWNITDRLSALACLHVSRHPGRRALLEEGYRLWKDRLSAYTGYLSIVGSGVDDDVFELLAAEERRPEFRIEHPTHSRALLMPMASNNRMLWTDRGIAWMRDTIIRMAAVNENTAVRLLACFQHVSKLAPDLKARVTEALEQVAARIEAERSPSLAGRVRAYLGGISRGSA